MRYCHRWKDLRNRLQEVLSDEPTNQEGTKDPLLLRPPVALADDEPRCDEASQRKSAAAGWCAAIIVATAVEVAPSWPQRKRSPTFVQPLFPVTDQDVKLRLGELLNKSLSRHDGSHCTCLHGSSNFVVTEAYQVNNLPLWRRYQRFVRSMQDKHKQHGISLEEINPSVSEALTDFAKHLNVDLTGNERLVVHGTQKFELARAIATEGFDNRVARDGLFGRGTYFAAQTCKSAQYATEDGRKSKASPQMMGTMLIARVAIGDPYYTPRGCADLSRALPESSLFCTLIESLLH